jgi:uncharacterized membrane protein YqjE
MPDKDEGSPDGTQSFLRPLRSSLGAIVAALHTRLELFVTELEEERERLKQSLILTLFVFFGFSLAFILFTIFVVAVFWQAGWVYAIGALAALYLAIGVIAGVMLRNSLLSRPGLFPAILSELGKDRDRLRSSGRE